MRIGREKMSEFTNYNMTAFVDGKAAKLRASCDACNESKVRCSQAKPTCARCQRQGITCFYGLSRRSHKNAPRVQDSRSISESGSASAENSNASSISTVSQEQSNKTPIKNPSSDTELPQDETTHGSVNAVSETTAALEKDLATGPDSTFLLPLNHVSGFGIYDQHVLSANDDCAENIPAHDPMDDILMAGNDFFGQYLSLSSLDAEGSIATRDGILSFETDHERWTSKRQPCSCVSRVIKQLVSMPLGFGDEKATFDSQLSHLRQAINIAEDCIKCICTSDDNLSMTMVTVSILVGHVIQGFESLLAEFSSSSGSSSSNIEHSSSRQASNVSSPGISWGLLQMDPDEEDELKQHLWLLQFRKLQRVLMQFNASTEQFRSMQDGGSSAHVMECQCIHLWLAQRTDIVKDKYRQSKMQGKNQTLEV
ncbi:MAG: hypothetical protein Q9191_001057 [Dirinaria sp. TL-2023a]